MYNNDDNLSKDAKQILSTLWNDIENETFEEIKDLLKKLENNDNTDDEINDALTRIKSLIPEEKWDEIEPALTRLSGRSDNPDRESIPKERLEEMIVNHSREKHIEMLIKKYPGLDFEKYQQVCILLEGYLNSHPDVYKKLDKEKIQESQKKLDGLKYRGDTVGILKHMITELDLWKTLNNKGLADFDGNLDMSLIYSSDFDYVNERFDDPDERKARMEINKKRKIDEAKHSVIWEQDLSDEDKDKITAIVNILIGDEKTASTAWEKLKYNLPITDGGWSVSDPDDYQTIYRKVLDLYQWLKT